MSQIISSSTDASNQSSDRPIPSTFTAIDGLRGFACLIVLCHHCYFHGGRYSYPTIKILNWKQSLSSLFYYGYSGVELFFILSGFCLAYSIIRSPNKIVNWRQYFIKRARRIYPAFIATMVILFTLSFIIHSQKIDIFIDNKFLEMPTSEQLFLSLSFVDFSFNTSFWTLCLELRWYLIFPLIILIYKRFNISGAFIFSIVISLIYSTFIYPSSQTQLKFILGPLPLYLPLFVLGVWAAHLLVTKPSSLVQDYITRYSKWGCLASLIPLFIVVPPEPFFGFSRSRIIPFGIFYFFLLVAALYDSSFQKFFSWKPLVFVGEFSYSLYLIHLPIIEGIYIFTKPMNWSDQTQFFFYQGFVFALCVFLGYLFYLLFEKPFLKEKIRLTNMN
jgi:peptidoglycan/LPS O-acetylase OafA/YrhL